MTLQRIFTIKEFTGYHMLAVMVLFFGTILAANLTMTWFAIDSWSGLVAKNGYVASIEFKDREEDFARQRALGWKSHLRVEGGLVQFSVKDSSGKAITGLNITASAKHPATEKADVALAFSEKNPGEYLAAAPARSGQWQIEILAMSAAKQSYRKKYRVLVKSQD